MSAAVKERFHFFAHSSSPFSQWYGNAPFVKFGITFKTAENFMMWRKGMLFDAPQHVLNRLINSSPRDAKALGRNIANFDERVWSVAARPFVIEGNIAKFAQNADIRKILFRTVGTTLVEAAPWDQIWGIGLADDDPRAHDRSTWRGTNWLGEVLTDIRDIMMLGMTETPLSN